MKFVKKPIVIEAFRYGFDKKPSWFFDNTNIPTPYAPITIHTLEGDMTANPGDYIIKGIQGEIYPCKADIFEATYSKFLES
ncbi:hypothetical protein UFOVP685_19 [uncultured Caudovirales phage]|uniref:Uncharacterized protein n=1 Tax=uncultured Caudovirales phage TaxID=2100421 RepID=A0A6J5NQ19_9CAUD|nr:hypothetical protein UFOVP590_4 [uncultured Caudovirales phage]CAB4157364.1 hypothetical protein UFOVP685_19 [uncultured Caudovirales phage]CAB5225463.1 hypothetical protein UFOVP750_33 [uncultured Caudovirales phage]